MKLSNILTLLPKAFSVILTLALYGFLFQFTPKDFEWPNFVYALIPGTTLLLLTLLSWLFPKPGGILFVLLGIGYAIFGYNRVSLTAIGVLSGAALVTGVLYFFQKRPKKEERLPEEKIEEEPAPAGSAIEEGKLEPEPIEEVVKEGLPLLPPKIEPEPEEEVAKEELPPLPPKIEPKMEDFATKEPPGPETPPVRKTAESETVSKSDKLPSWKEKTNGRLPDISLTTKGASISGGDLEPEKKSIGKTTLVNQKTNGPSQEFMKWVKRQKLK